MAEKYLEVEKDIPFGTVFAYRKGDKIAESAVKANGWEDYVAAPSKSTKDATAAASEEKK